MSAAVKAPGSRLRKVECTACGCIARMSRAAMARSGVPYCGCGAGRMLVVDVEDAFAVLPDSELYAHPDVVKLARAEQERDIRQARRVGAGQLQCGGCHAYIPASNHDCSCGFANDIRSGRNHGRWVSGASYCPQWKSEQEMPF